MARKRKGISKLDEWMPYFPEPPSASFEDIGGHDEIKDELRDVLRYLHGDAKKVPRIQCRMPKGVLLVGPPGVGKTYLARAVAGEASLPLFVISASELIEIFVGVGASRVRRLFEAARKRSPSVVFIDEIDSIGRIRGGTTVFDSSERDQTLNTLLSELDGFTPLEGVLVIAATNRFEVLDTALRRPGRFDLVFYLTYPDLADRQKVFKACLRAIACSREVTNDMIISFAERTSGASQAEIDSIVRRALQLAMRRAASEVEVIDLHKAISEWDKSSHRQQLLDSFLTESKGVFYGAKIRPRTRVVLFTGEVIEGYAQWQDSHYIKIQTPERPLGMIIARFAIVNLEFIGYWDAS